MRRFILVASMALLAMPAWAETNLNRASKGYTYFYRQGADIEGHGLAVKGCVEEAARTAQGDPQATGGADGVLASALAPTLLGPLITNANRNADAANIENCMVVRGWAVVQIDPEEGASLAILAPDQQRSVLANWVGADRPHGTVTRSFGNDLISGSTKYDGRPGNFDRLSLSVTAVNLIPDPSRRRVVRPSYDRMIKSGALNAPVPDKEWKSIGPTETVVIFRIIQASPAEFNGIHFSLDDPIKSFGSVHFAIFQHNAGIFGKRMDKYYVFRLSEGRWRMDKLRSAMGALPSVSLCLGAPGFTIAEGQALYGGTIQMAGDGRFIPTIDIETARGDLSAIPELAARMTPAKWVNGTTAACGLDSYIYALEIPGTPFVEGYTAGSQAQTAP